MLRFLIMSFLMTTSLFLCAQDSTFLLQMAWPNFDTVHVIHTRDWKKKAPLSLDIDPNSTRIFHYTSDGELFDIDIHNITVLNSDTLVAKFTKKTFELDENDMLQPVVTDSCFGKNIVGGERSVFMDKKDRIYYYAPHYTVIPAPNLTAGVAHVVLDTNLFNLTHLNFENKDLDTVFSTEFIKENNAEALRAHMAAYRDKIVIFYTDGKERKKNEEATLVRVYDYDFQQIGEDFYIPMDVREAMVLRDKCRGDEIYLFGRTDLDYIFYETVTVHKFDLESKTILPDTVAKIPMQPFVGIRVAAPPYQKIEVDLDADDPSSYDYSTYYCGDNAGSSIAKNVCLQSWMPPDSIILHLSGTIDGDSESLSYSGADCTLTDLGGKRYKLTLSDSDAFVTDGYVTALQDIRYRNDLAEPSVGTRQIDITTYYKGKSKKVTSTIHILDKNPNAGRDTSLSICKHHVISSLSDAIKASPGGTWVTPLSATDAFDPSTDTWRSNQYVVGNEHCGSDTLHLDIEVTDHAYASRTVTICREDSYTHKGIDYAPMQSFQDTIAHGGSDCDSIYTVSIAAYDIPNKKKDIYVCAGETVTHNGTQYAAGDTYSYSVSHGNACDTTVEARVIAHPTLTTDIPDTLYITQDTSLYFSTAPWSIDHIAPNTTGLNHEPQALHIPYLSEVMQYHVDWHIPQACTERTLLTIIPYDAYKKIEFLSFPNVVALDPIQPINGIFALKSSTTLSYALTVYDRWGNIVYHNDSIDSSNRRDGWDVRNSAINTGVYVYHIKVNGSQKVYVGEFTVL